jgi:hypothetical protein
MARQHADALQRAGGLAIWDQINGCGGREAFVR